MDFYGMLMSFVAEAETWKTLAQTFPAGISMVSTCHASISPFPISKGMPMRKLPPSGPLDKKGTSANKDRFAVMQLCHVLPCCVALDRRYQTISNLHSFPDRTFPSNILPNFANPNCPGFLTPKLPEELVRHLGVEGDGVAWPLMFDVLLMFSCSIVEPGLTRDPRWSQMMQDHPRSKMIEGHFSDLFASRADWPAKTGTDKLLRYCTGTGRRTACCIWTCVKMCPVAFKPFPGKRLPCRSTLAFCPVKRRNLRGLRSRVSIPIFIWRSSPSLDITDSPIILLFSGVCPPSLGYKYGLGKSWKHIFVRRRSRRKTSLWKAWMRSCAVLSQFQTSATLEWTK